MEIPLKCNCPPSCPCGSKEPKKWHHDSCLKESRINDLGDISCVGHEQRKETCQPYFIQHASFKCSKSNTWEQYRSATQFLMALAQGLQAAEFGLTDNQIVDFSTKLNIQVMTRWKR